ncbi:MAG: 2-phosphosulfolactate phosphatase [Candidatus Riflebacteria bacterium]|nr:2-phosphosulfolactate phosphatase [Candidatus Riflebacteria bacterium]
MNIDVAFTPFEVQGVSKKVCLVVDVMRATSTLTILMSKKPAEVILSPTVQKAVSYASKQTAHPVLCGERAGTAPVGFDHGISPREYLDLDLSGKSIIFTSGNCARAVMDVAIAPHVLLGSFLNAEAVVQMAYQLSIRDSLDILVVCSGVEERFALDDAYCAGYIISLLAGSIPCSEEFSLGDGGQAALGIYGYYRDPAKVMRECLSGRYLAESGYSDDVEYLLQKSLYKTVPMLLNKNFDDENDAYFTILT